MDDPFPARGLPDDFTDMMRPDDNYADSRTAGVDSLAAPFDRARQPRVMLSLDLHHPQPTPRDAAVPMMLPVVVMMPGGRRGGYREQH